MQLDEILKRTRQRVFMSQDEFAKIIGTSVSTINRWENGKCRPSLPAMKSIKDFCESHGIFFNEIEEAWFIYTETNKEN